MLSLHIVKLFVLLASGIHCTWGDLFVELEQCSLPKGRRQHSEASLRKFGKIQPSLAEKIRIRVFACIYNQEVHDPRPEALNLQGSEEAGRKEGREKEGGEGGREGKGFY